MGTESHGSDEAFAKSGSRAARNELHMKSSRRLFSCPVDGKVYILLSLCVGIDYRFHAAYAGTVPQASGFNENSILARILISNFHLSIAI